jgi:hypothetical protein
VERNKARILIGADAYVIDAMPRLLGSAYQRFGVWGTRLAKRFGVGGI